MLAPPPCGLPAPGLSRECRLAWQAVQGLPPRWRLLAGASGSDAVAAVLAAVLVAMGTALRLAFSGEPLLAAYPRCAWLLQEAGRARRLLLREPSSAVSAAWMQARPPPPPPLRRPLLDFLAGLAGARAFRRKPFNSPAELRPVHWPLLARAVQRLGPGEDLGLAVALVAVLEGGGSVEELLGVARTRPPAASAVARLRAAGRPTVTSLQALCLARESRCRLRAVPLPMTAMVAQAAALERFYGSRDWDACELAALFWCVACGNVKNHGSSSQLSRGRGSQGLRRTVLDERGTAYCAGGLLASAEACRATPLASTSAFGRLLYLDGRAFVLCVQCLMCREAKSARGRLCFDALAPRCHICQS